jgi:hypothetical protein
VTTLDTGTGISTSGSPPQPSAAPPSGNGVVTADAWEQAGVHTVYMPSGVKVRVRLPDLEAMIREDALPDTLRAAAVRELEGGLQPDTAKPEGETWDLVKEVLALYEHVAHSMLVEPTTTPEQFKRLPAEDRQMLREIAMRQRGTDARGVVLGVEPLSRWETFRIAHQCPESCPACDQVLAEFSTVGSG